MTKEEFILYISKDNPGFYKTRKSHIKKVAPELLKEIEVFLTSNNIQPINFNDGLKYYLNNVKDQNTCTCGKIIKFGSSFCSNTCKKKNIHIVLEKSKSTLKEKYGEDSPLKIKQFKEKFKQTSIDKYDVEHPSENNNVKEKIKNSNINTYKDPKIREKLGNSISKAYKENGDNIIEKRKISNFKNYKEYKILTSKSVLKTKDTLKRKYNVSSPFKIHNDTYEKAKMGSINFFNKKENKEQCIRKRINTIKSKYGSIDNMNKRVFEKKKHKILDNLRNYGLKDEVIKYNKIGFITCKCDKNHIYEASLQLIRDRLNKNNPTCTICLPVNKNFTSSGEQELFDWLSQYVHCERHNRKLMNGSEIDIYIPEKNIGIEFNGIYWHSDLFKDKNYHLNKTLILKDKGIKLIHVLEDQWTYKKDIVKHRILSQLNLIRRKIGARECNIKILDSKIANDFFENNHLQGKTKASTYVGLMYKNELVSAIAVGKRKIGKNKDNNFEILRFCNKLDTNCIGSFSKLFKHIKKEYKGTFISYSDLSWGEGKVYENANFKLLKYSKPNYWYFLDNKRYHRYSFTKNNLVKLGYNENKTEKEIMDEDVKALRIYDCGNAVWEYKNL